MAGSVRLLYRFADDVRAVRREGLRLTLDVENWKALAFDVPGTAEANAIEALHGAGVTFARLLEIAGTRMSYYVERFARARLLVWVLADDGGALAHVAPLAASYRPLEEARPEGVLELSRFALVRRVDSGMVIESGLVRARLSLEPRGLAALAAVPEGFDEALWRLGFFEVAGAPESEARRCWEFHDLLMHETSRINRDVQPLGATYRFAKEFAAPPAIKPAPAGERIALPAVDAASVRQSSGALAAVQEARKSIRTFSAQPIALPALGEFLWRVCRTTEHLDVSRQNLLSRPYPGGGSIHELEFYVAVRRCTGLEPAVYHYDSHGHGLVRLAGSESAAARIVRRSTHAMGLTGDAPSPDLTIVVASRLPRLAWKYQGMAYRASLMNAGVLFELMYLVATDMKLAPCANGSGDSRLLEEATGLDPFEETAIAEFCLALPG